MIKHPGVVAHAYKPHTRLGGYRMTARQFWASLSSRVTSFLKKPKQNRKTNGSLSLWGASTEEEHLKDGVSGEVVGVGNVLEREHGPSLQFSSKYCLSGQGRAGMLTSLAVT